ncbi:site-specific DNA-methyltransferase [Burkholderia pseudomallei]|uniref:site-specific DNA-methyltransferase n=1 Tax=Burkholderia pseudomallei TaxID=28450 RepID=UPI0019E1C4E2|nr:site-specific DNA-methyltransferase [Burkholderia pseudomallei]HDR9271206.1 site-specific DNA-methyltransferase [Burkholderia vietnamiensis]
MSDTSVQYEHKQEAVQRPDVGVQDQFSIKKPNRVYSYDSSLDPAMSWDENRERELGEWLIGLVARCAEEGEAAVFQAPQVWKGGGVQVQSLKAATGLLQTLSQPFLNWAGKAERHQLSVPTTPLFVHERHSTKAILEGIESRKAKGTNLDLFGDPHLDVTDRLDAYEHKGPWQNRMILGDSLQVMNSMLEFEGLGGQVQMVFFDPPYGVRFGSNFQPFVRKRDVKHGADDAMTREPEMVKAYRDTWELGLHSYLTYMRDRLMLAKELLNESGSIFVQISDENLHHVRELMDEVFGQNNFVSIIQFAKTSGLEAASSLSSACDYLVWYARDKERVKYRSLWESKSALGSSGYTHILLKDGSSRRMTSDEVAGKSPIPDGARIFTLSDLTKPGPGSRYDVDFEGRRFSPGARWWGTTPESMARLIEAGRICAVGNTLRFIRYLDDFPVSGLNNLWADTGIAGFSSDKLYVVQTSPKVIQRCMLMCTEPGDLVFDPTCGSGTTAYVAEQWGRRWITCDTSRVPLALARQRLLTATFPYYELKDPKLGPAGGFIYQRKQNRKGEEVGGLVPHVTLKSIANDEQPAMEVLVDRPEERDRKDVVRVAGPFVVEATIAPAQTMEALDGTARAQSDGTVVDAEPMVTHGDVATHIERMTQVLRQSKTLRLPGNRELVLEQVRRTNDGDILHAEASDADGKRVAIVFGPESGAISADMVFEAAREAHFLRYDQLYFFAFAIQAKARELIEERNKDGAPKLRIHCTYVAVTPDVAMSDLLKTTRASEIFSVTGLPDVKLTKLQQKNNAGEALYQVDVKGLDIFNPANMEQESVEGENLPCWMLDTDYDPSGSFYATQVFFPKTGAWGNLQKSLKASFDESVWSHLAGTTSEPFVLGERRRIAVKVIDERGNELMRVIENIA